MNRDIFIQRFKECRKRKFKTQQMFADAYKDRFGMIRDTDLPASGSGMFGTVQSWEQGKSTPTAEVLANICELLECDADYLLGRINEYTHDVETVRCYTGLSTEAIEKLHYYADQLAKEEWWIDEEANRQHFLSFGLFLIDELLAGSKNNQLNASMLAEIFEYEYEWMDSVEDVDIEDFHKIESYIYSIVHSITSILTENARQRAFPPALLVRRDTESNTYQFRLSSRRGIEPGEWEEP